jgi:6-phosphogluconolactonase
VNIPQIKVVPDADAIARYAADQIVALARESIERDGTFTIALSGGSTPKKLFELLASDEYRNRIDWPKVEVFFVDERCVPADHPESNYRLAHETLLSKVPIPPGNVYRMKGEDPDPNHAAADYGLMLRDKFGDGGLDLVLLGMGEDGHTASLFPGTAAVNETKHRVVANYAEHSTTGRSWRLTMTAPFINRARNVFVLVSGANKAKRLAEVLEGPRDPQRLPIQLIYPEEGQMTWIVDAGAAGMR